MLSCSFQDHLFFSVKVKIRWHFYAVRLLFGCANSWCYIKRWHFTFQTTALCVSVRQLSGTRRTRNPVQTSCSSHAFTLRISNRNDTVLAETIYWIFTGRLRTCQDCSILARGGHAIKGDESRKCLLLIAPRNHYRWTSAAAETGHMP